MSVRRYNCARGREGEERFRALELEHMVVRGKLEAKMEENANLYAHINVGGREGQRAVAESEGERASLVERFLSRIRGKR
jgi:hypothetical protein